MKRMWSEFCAIESKFRIAKAEDTQNDSLGIESFGMHIAGERTQSERDQRSYKPHHSFATLGLDYEHRTDLYMDRKYTCLGPKTACVRLPARL